MGVPVAGPRRHTRTGGVLWHSHEITATPWDGAPWEFHGPPPQTLGSPGRSLNVPWKTHGGLVGVPWARTITQGSPTEKRCNLMESMEVSKGVPREMHGRPIEFPWGAHESHTMSHCYDLTETPWELHGKVDPREHKTRMGALQTHESPMGLPWAIAVNPSPMGVPWDFHGPSL